MRSLRLVLGLSAAALPGFAIPAAGQGLAARAGGVTISELSAPPGTRTVCLGSRRDGIRMVGCFDVYRLGNGGVSDPTRGIDLQQYVWKYTAEAQGSPGGEQLVGLRAEVASEAASTYDWAPDQSVELDRPQDVEALVTTDLVAESEPGGTPRLANPMDGWRFRGFTGWIDPHLSDHRFATSWTAPEGVRIPAREAVQVAGATIWAAPAPGPDLLPARLRLEVTYR